MYVCKSCKYVHIIRYQSAESLESILLLFVEIAYVAVGTMCLFLKDVYMYEFVKNAVKNYV